MLHQKEQRRSSPIVRYLMSAQAAGKTLAMVYTSLPKHGGCERMDDPNAFHRWCRFKREVIKKSNYHKNHFSLTEEKRALLETTLDVNI